MPPRSVTFPSVGEEAGGFGNRTSPDVFDLAPTDAEALELCDHHGSKRGMGALPDAAMEDGFGRVGASGFRQGFSDFFGDFVAPHPGVGTDGCQDVLGACVPSCT